MQRAEAHPSVFKPQQIYVHPLVVTNPLTQGILKKLPNVPREVAARPLVNLEGVSDGIGHGKRTWFITASPGQLVKECPATPKQLCCRYRVINVITNCPIDCSYCILQGYINQPYITINVNLEDIKAQVRELVATDPHHIFRFGTGELSDSMALEEYTGFSYHLVEFFLTVPNGFFEIKTKYHRAHKLLGLDPKGRIGISWSVNPEEVIKEEEKGASPLTARLKAARQCQERGYLVGFHFDPIILSAQWGEKYRRVVDRIFTFTDHKRITWISLGGFRYPAFLKPLIRERFPETKILLGELFPGPDGKYRYLRRLRIEMYQTIVARIRDYDPDVLIYLCMESPEVWNAVFGSHPASREDLDHLFAKRIRGLWREAGSVEYP